VYSYLTYGLGIRSVLPLPELVATETEADVTIRPGNVPRSPEEVASPRSCFRATAEEAGFYWREVGTFLVRGGQEMIIDPAPGVEERVLRLFILGPALALLLHQRGFLILHASAVAVDGVVAAFLGGTGWGKSTTAAALHTRGHGMVADDILALDVDDPGGATVLPGFPQLKLWPEAAASLRDVPEELPRLHPRMEKRALRDADGFPQTPLPLRRIYVLAEGAEQEIVPIEPQGAFVELVRHSYVARLLEETGAAALHFGQCARLVQTVPVRRLITQRSLTRLADLAQMVEQDVAEA
jgi:hypothetical protein